MPGTLGRAEQRGQARPNRSIQGVSPSRQCWEEFAGQGTVVKGRQAEQSWQGGLGRAGKEGQAGRAEQGRAGQGREG